MWSPAGESHVGANSKGVQELNCCTKHLVFYRVFSISCHGGSLGNLTDNDLWSLDFKAWQEVFAGHISKRCLGTR